MKRILPIFAVLLALPPAAAQERFLPLEQWDVTPYCSFRDLHPLEVVRADNNWEVLWTLRRAGTSRELEARGIAHTRSQLLLLVSQRLLVRSKEGTLRTAVPIIDSLPTQSIRRAAAGIAAAMAVDLEPGLRSFAAELRKEGFGENAFSLLFSYILDGTIWKEFERRGIVEARDDSQAWSGCLWFSYPRSNAFRPGTNALSWDGRRTLYVNWADDDPAFASRMYGADAQRFFRLLLANEKIDAAAAEVGRELGLYDGMRATIPVLSGRGAIARQAERLTRSVCDSFLHRAGVPRVREMVNCEKTSDAVVIFYHEVMWQLCDRLLASGIVRLPRLFADPAHAVPTDMSAVCFVTTE